MVPNINPNGRSFRGAGAYHLHDKGGELSKHPTTSKRVAWTATRNLVNDDPEKALDEMWRTAEDARHLKQASGHEWRRRREAMPVKTMSLSWAPHQTPSREEMEAAADSFLKAMGWQEHQALLIPHSDTAHPHLHIILNRVHPETGLVLNDWREQQRAQRWGDQNEREQGLILCHARAEKYEKARFDLQTDGMPYPFAKLAEEQERAFENPLAAAAVQDLTDNELLAKHHQEEREAFLASGKAQFREVRQAVYREVRDEFKLLWREHHRASHQVHDHLEQQTATTYRQAVRLAREGDHPAATKLLAALDEQRDAGLEALAADKRELRAHQLETTRERQDQACRALIEQRRLDFQEIKDRQQEERAEFKVLQTLREAGQPYDLDRLQLLLGQDAPAIANDNRAPAEPAQIANQNWVSDRDPVLHEINPFMLAAQDLFPIHAGPEERAPHRDVGDLAAGAIGAAIEIGLRLMEGLISPPSPQEQAIAKARAIREEQEAPDRAAALEEQKSREDFTRVALAAAREAEVEREHDRKLDREDRDRGRYRER